uniref:Uncharacterized protein n=1 Tax=viral metagenome TaxID=1070528 RepID=A0A6H1ZAS1_9ZZZZ
MILLDAYNQLGRRTGLDPDITADQDKMRDGMEEALKQIYRRTKLIALKTDATLTLVADTYFYYLDHRYLYGLNFTENLSTDSSDRGVMLDVRSKQWFDRNYPNPDTSDTGKPEMIVPMYKVWVSAQPTAASVLAVVSSTADTETVRVRGLVSGVEVVESVTLTGTTAANTSNTYDANGVISITKKTTTGTITVTSNSAAVTNISLLPTEKGKTHWKVRVHKVPDAAYSIPYTFFRTPWDFSGSESDRIPFDETFDDAFILLATAILQKMDNKDQWKDNWTLAMGMIEEVKDNNYFSVDEDATMGLIELDTGSEWWH